MKIDRHSLPLWVSWFKYLIVSQVAIHRQIYFFVDCKLFCCCFSDADYEGKLKWNRTLMIKLHAKNSKQMSGNVQKRICKVVVWKGMTYNYSAFQICSIVFISKFFNE